MGFFRPGLSIQRPFQLPRLLLALLGALVALMAAPAQSRVSDQPVSPGIADQLLHVRVVVGGNVLRDKFDFEGVLTTLGDWGFAETRVQLYKVGAVSEEAVPFANSMWFTVPEALAQLQSFAGNENFDPAYTSSGLGSVVDSMRRDVYNFVPSSTVVVSLILYFYDGAEQIEWESIASQGSIRRVMIITMSEKALPEDTFPYSRFMIGSRGLRLGAVPYVELPLEVRYGAAALLTRYQGSDLALSADSCTTFAPAFRVLTPAGSYTQNMRAFFLGWLPDRETSTALAQVVVPADADADEVCAGAELAPWRWLGAADDVLFPGTKMSGPCARRWVNYLVTKQWELEPVDRSVGVPESSAKPQPAGRAAAAAAAEAAAAAGGAGEGRQRDAKRQTGSSDGGAGGAAARRAAAAKDAAAAKGETGQKDKVSSKRGKGEAAEAAAAASDGDDDASAWWPELGARTVFVQLTPEQVASFFDEEKEGGRRVLTASLKAPAGNPAAGGAKADGGAEAEAEAEAAAAEKTDADAAGAADAAAAGGGAGSARLDTSALTVPQLKERWLEEVRGWQRAAVAADAHMVAVIPSPELSAVVSRDPQFTAVSVMSYGGDELQGASDFGRGVACHNPQRTAADEAEVAARAVRSLSVRIVVAPTNDDATVRARSSLAAETAARRLHHQGYDAVATRVFYAGLLGCPDAQPAALRAAEDVAIDREVVDEVTSEGLWDCVNSALQFDGGGGDGEKRMLVVVSGNLRYVFGKKWATDFAAGVGHLGAGDNFVAVISDETKTESSQAKYLTQAAPAHIKFVHTDELANFVEIVLAGAAPFFPNSTVPTYTTTSTATTPSRATLPFASMWALAASLVAAAVAL